MSESRVTHASLVALMLMQALCACARPLSTAISGRETPRRRPQNPSLHAVDLRRQM